MLSLLYKNIKNLTLKIDILTIIEPYITVKMMNLIQEFFQSNRQEDNFDNY